MKLTQTTTRILAALSHSLMKFPQCHDKALAEWLEFETITSASGRPSVAYDIPGLLQLNEMDTGAQKYLRRELHVKKLNLGVG